uniref:Uncharacterized protein n=1 Tax=Arundo donax TaxID=35708 RepID=A0A0A9C261_ARUDO
MHQKHSIHLPTTTFNTSNKGQTEILKR